MPLLLISTLCTVTGTAVNITFVVMKVISILLSALIMGSSLYAQIPRMSKTEVKDKKEYRKDIQKSRDIKLKGESKKELKRLEKENWVPAGGAQPLALQIAARDMMEEAKENGMTYGGDGVASGTSFNTIMKQALQAAKENIAEQMSGEISELIESSAANENERQSYSKFATASKDLISRKLGTVQPTISRMRNNPDGTMTVVIRVYYNKEEIDKIKHDIIEQKLESESQDVKDRLTEILGW